MQREEHERYLQALGGLASVRRREESTPGRDDGPTCNSLGSGSRFLWVLDGFGEMLWLDCILTGPMSKAQTYKNCSLDHQSNSRAFRQLSDPGSEQRWATESLRPLGRCDQSTPRRSAGLHNAASGVTGWRAQNPLQPRRIEWRISGHWWCYEPEGRAGGTCSRALRLGKLSRSSTYLSRGLWWL